MRELPSGTVTLVFTDIEGSTRLLRELGERYADALAQHRSVLREAFAGHGGVEVDTQGDAFFFAFASARGALQAAAQAQRALAEGPVSVRIGVHTGEPLRTEEGYVGIDVHRAARVMAAGHGGQVLVTEAARRLAGDELELVDLGPQRLKDMTAPERLFQLGAGEFPPLRTLNQTNLPVTANPLLGRERELGELTSLFENGARLVTITGPGGTGKTRLAVQVAAELVERFRDGVFWVPLAGLRDCELVLPSIAQTLGAQDDLGAFLLGRETLVLLDNLEHLLAAAGSLTELVAAGPELRLLVTSRAALRLEGEHEFPLDPLADEGAVELFLERARQAGARLQASETIRTICRRLDNLPLAIELAAGRARLLGAAGLLARLEQRLPLLTGGRRDVPERQRTLRATIEWSHELLALEAKELFARLAVFSGSFSLEAAEQICDADLDALADLAELSLLKPVGDGRFLMLETIREYADERLGERAEGIDLQERHARWYLALAEDAESRYYSTGQAALFEQLDSEHDNLRAALDWLHGRFPELELRLAGTLHDFWIARGHVSEGRARLESALADGGHVADAVLAKALDGAAWLATAQLDYEQAMRFGTEALALARSLGEPKRIVSSLSTLGAAEVQQGRYTRGRELFDEALERARAAGDELSTTIVLGQLSDLALYEGAFADVETFATECLERARASDDFWTMAVSLANIGLAVMHRGDDRGATFYFARSLELALEVGARHIAVVGLEGLAAVAAEEDPRDAARLVGAAQQTLKATGSALPPFEARMHAETIAQLEERLGGEELERLLAEGAEMPLEAAVALARESAGYSRQTAARSSSGNDPGAT